MNIFQACYNILALAALIDTSLAFGTRSFIHTNPTKSGNYFKFAATTENVDLSVPYDAAAQLAYDAAGSSDDFETFKARYKEEAVQLVISKKKNLSSGDAEAAKGESTSTEEEDTKPKNPLVAKVQSILRSKQRAYQNYLINRGMELKLKPIYERKGKIDTYTPRPIYDAETERLLKEVWEAEGEVRVVEAQSMSSGSGGLAQENESLQEENKKLKAAQEQSSQQLSEKEQEISSLNRGIESLEQKGQSLQEENSSLKAAQDESSRQLSEKEQEISSLNTGLRSLESTLENEQMESARKDNEIKLLETRLSDIEADVARLVMELQEKRGEIASQYATIDSLKSQLGTTEAALRVLEEERASVRMLARQSWRVISPRIRKRAVRVKNFLLRRSKDEKLEEIDDDTNGVNIETIEEDTAVALRNN